MKPGKKAPDFSLRDKEGTLHSLKTLEGRYLVVYFYPKDDTPGCTVEAKGFSGAKNKLAALGASVVGISGGDEKSKTKFCKKHRLKVLLLSDPGFKVSRAYGSYGRKKFMGRAYMGILRNTYLLDEARRVVRVFENVNPETHVREIIAHISELEEACRPEGSRMKVAPHRLPRAAVKAARSVTRPKRKKRPLRGNRRRIAPPKQR